MRKLLLLSTCAIVCHMVLYAQFQFGSVNGLVRDPSQAPAPDSTVEIRSKSTNVVQRTVSSASGEYAFVSLPPDQYVLTVTHPGFKTVARSLQLSVDQRLQLDVTLEIGNVAEQVSVTSQAPLLEAQTSEIGNVEEQKQVVDLPLNTRNFTQLVDLAPGVNNRGTSSNSVLQGYTSGRGANGAVINGAPPKALHTCLMACRAWIMTPATSSSSRP